MASLAEQLNKIVEGAKSRIPPDKLAVMEQVTQDQYKSGLLDGVIKPGAPLPPFSLSNSRGEMVESKDLLAQGAVVISVFRGSW